MVGVRPNLLACGSQPISKLRFCPEVRGRRRGPRFPRGRSASRSGSRGSQRARSPLPRPASPRPLSRPPAEESAGARQFLPRGGRERLRDPSHLTHSHTHTHTHTRTHTHSHTFKDPVILYICFGSEFAIAQSRVFIFTEIKHPLTFSGSFTPSESLCSQREHEKKIPPHHL